MSGAVLCLGRLWCDILFTGLPRMPELGAEIFAEDVTLAPGGGAFITAARLAALGREVFLVSRLGLDPLSQALEPALRRSGVDLAYLDRAADAGPQPTVALIHAGERAFVSRRAGGSRPASLQVALDRDGVAHLHIAEFATLHDLPEVIGAAKARGLTISLDPSWDDALIHRADFLDLCAGVDVFLPNEAEFDAVTGGMEVSAGLDRLARLFPVTALKRGPAGAMLAVGPDQRASSPAPAVAVVDTTGAGDSFNAGFLHAWLAGASPLTALAAGIAAGSAAVGRVGG